MDTKRFTSLAVISLTALLLITGATLTASAQGRGRGGGGGNSGGGNRGMGGGMGNGAGVDRGIGTASERSGGRSDRGLGTASERSNGRADTGLERARAADENGRRADEELQRHPGIAHGLNTRPSELRSQYQAALATNPNLKFGQFVAANVLANNLGATHPNITTVAILNGLQNGQSIGQTLQSLGLSSSEAKEAEKRAKHQIKANRR
ncbi:MAG TPA: hypothetical protein VIW80_17580 [Pyrinomonadaceae bacterium]|jgi:hypothetical protein